jgi:hypothetical protein
MHSGRRSVPAEVAGDIEAGVFHLHAEVFAFDGYAESETNTPSSSNRT